MPVAPPAPPPTCVAILLAAGGGERFEGATHKLLAPLRGGPVAARAVKAVLRAGFSHVVVVTGAVPLPLPDHPALHVVHHPGWHAGQATSLQVGLDAARSLGADSVVVGLADQPFITADDWRRVAAAGSAIAVATFDGHRSPPVLLDRSVWPLLPASGDEGARALMRLRPELVSEIPCTGNPGDVDTLEDLARWS